MGKEKWQSKPRVATMLGIGAGVSIACILILGLIATALAAASDDPTGLAGIYSFVALLTAGAISGFWISRSMGAVGAKIAAISTLVTVIVMLCFAMILCKGAPGASAGMNYLCYGATSLFFAFIGKKREKPHGQKRHRRR